MVDSLYPRIPYDDVRSACIRTQIQNGSFYDIDHRRYVNSLVFVEWLAREGIPDGCTGISASGLSFRDALVALKYPEGYDTVRTECGEPPRAARSIRQNRDEDSENRRDWARRHRNEWQVVKHGEDYRPDTAVADIPIEERGEFNWFRFPRIPYHNVESEFIRTEIQRGAFDEYEYRQYVNRLIFVEQWMREGLSAVKTSYYHPIRAYRVAAKVPDGFRIIQTECGAPQQDESLLPDYVNGTERDEQKEQRYRDSWQAVQQREGY